MFVLLVPVDIPIKPISVLLVKIVNTFKQHLPKKFFQPKVGEMEIDEMSAQTVVQNRHIIGWTIIEEEQLTKINLGFEENLQQVKINVDMNLLSVINLLNY
jgi:hypothetical protein